MKRSVCVLLFCVCVQVIHAALPVPDTQEYQLIEAQDTIRFIRIAQQAEVPKPVLLFLQGSLPYPLIVTRGERASVFYLDQCDFDYATLGKHYNIVLIAKPHTPVVADTAQLNAQGQYIPDPAQPDRFSPAYLADDLPECYTQRANAVLDFIRHQPWAQAERIIVMGHSQGAYVAALVAAANPDIYAVGYFSGNPMGRFAELIAAQDNAAKSGRITRSAAQKNITRLYTQWRQICRGEQCDAGDRNATWRGFSRPLVDTLAALPMPLYIAYGTEDPGGQHGVLLPIYFELAGKHNYQIRAYEGRGHNFEAVHPDGGSDYGDMKWKDAIEEFLAWCENAKN